MENAPVAEGDSSTLHRCGRSDRCVEWIGAPKAQSNATDVITAADILADLDDDLQQEGIELCFAEMKDRVKDRFATSDCSRSLVLSIFSQHWGKQLIDTWKNTT